MKKKKCVRLSLIGPPGTGKGTQAVILAKQYKITTYSVGNLLRKEVRKKTVLGKKIKKDLENGNLVVDAVVYKLLDKTLRHKESFILDGFPRDVSQARNFSMINYVIYLNSSKSNTFKRLLKRAHLESRKDDMLETIEHRWDVFKKKTSPVVAYYKKKGILHEVDGNKNIHQVSQELFILLDKDKRFQRLLGR